MNKYIIQITEKENSTYKFYQTWINNHQGVILEANVGERGWFAYKLEKEKDMLNPEDALSPWHRVHTSIVESVIETEDGIEVVTENSIYRFVKEE